MTKIFAICVDFNHPTQATYEAFFKRLESLGPWCHYIEFTWLLATTLQADEINHKLADFLDTNIHLLIMEIGQDVSGWLPDDAWEWISSHRSEVNGNGNPGQLAASAAFSHST